MALKISALRAAAYRSDRVSVPKTLGEAILSKTQTAFLCHSHKDKELAKGLQVILKEQGWDLYIDWQDNEMPATPNRETAKRIKDKIEITDWFLFLATVNSTSSRWCPWEIGFADAKKSYEKIVMIPTEDANGNWHGNEYLQLYKNLSDASNSSTKKSGYAVFEAASKKSGTWVELL
ncbi:toll/interleukin-1 receptor domain-containing protein [Granulosicoccus sp.]|nr:toll/interleukin-1 receptor domain-containing protein [Granulosicoccus sp.]MDB4223670.1 toll/interleukin-1 receptor domain-containing protein [Granulosicoccus sp.]